MIHGDCLIQVCRASEKTWSITRGCLCEPFFVSKVSNGSPVVRSTCHICTVRIYILGCQACKTFEKPCACKYVQTLSGCSLAIDPILSITQQTFRCTLGKNTLKKACFPIEQHEKGSQVVASVNSLQVAVHKQRLEDSQDKHRPISGGGASACRRLVDMKH